MDWWQTASLMGTLVLTGTAVATFGWRVLRQETDKLREESRRSHERIGGEIARLRGDQEAALVQVRDDLRGEIARLRIDQDAALMQVRDEIARLRIDQDAALARARDDLGADINQLREGQASLLEGQASLREGLGEIRGELRGLTHSMLTLREDFRAHVLAGAG